MKITKSILAGLGAISLASLGIFSGGSAKAASAVSLSDNPNSASKITIKHVISNGITNPTVEYGYKVQKCGVFPDGSNPAPMTGTIRFSNSILNSVHVTSETDLLDLSGLTFGAAGTYEFCVTEESATPSTGISYDSTNQYKIFVDVTNEKDSNGDYTGNLVATLAPQALNMTTGEKDGVIFWSEPDTTYIEVTHTVEGDRANFEQYFSYYLNLDTTRTLPVGTDVAIGGIDEYYIDPADGQSKKNLTVAKTGTGDFVWLKKDQVMTIGVENGKNRLPEGFVYNMTIGNRSSLESIYAFSINGDYSGINSVLNRTELIPGEDASEETVAKFNRMNKVAIKRYIAGSVSTGVTSKVLPFAVLAILGVAAGVGIKYFAEKTKKARS